MKRLGPSITSDQINHLVVSFLRGRFRYVQEFRITDARQNVRNPQKEMWEFWGPSFLKVFGVGKVSVNKLTPPEPVSFELDVSVSRKGDETGYTGRVLEKGRSSTRPHKGSLSRRELSETAQGFLKKKFPRVRNLNVHFLRETSVHGEFVYQLWGDLMASENELFPARLTQFKLTVYISRAGRVILRRGRTWR